MSIRHSLARSLLQFIGLLTVVGLIVTVISAVVLPRILQVEDKIGKADYILPLAGEWHRYFRAAELYRSGAAPKVLLSNAHVRPPSRFDATLIDMGIDIPRRRELRRRLLVHLGVPEEALVSFGNGHISTAEEAEALRDFLASNAQGKPHSIILVTSPYHTRRAKTIFSDTLPDVTFTITSPPEGRVAARWWQDRKSAIYAVTESFKFLHYLLGGRFRAANAEG